MSINKMNKIGEAKVDLNKMFIKLKNKINKINNADKMNKIVDVIILFFNSKVIKLIQNFFLKL